jgi:hypothetical protein
MTFQSVLIFLGLTLALSLAAHWVVRRYWLAVLISVAAASVANIIHEAFLQDFQVRPADIAFWIPMEFFQGMVFALPVAAVVGIPFYVIRRRRHSNPA